MDTFEELALKHAIDRVLRESPSVVGPDHDVRALTDRIVLAIAAIPPRPEYENSYRERDYR